MKPDNLLDEALARGVITNEQRAQLAALGATDAPGSDERIKPVGSFNEIFVTVGVMILLNAVRGMIDLMIGGSVIPAILCVALTVLVAEHFHRKKRFRLPVIYAVLSAAYALGTFVLGEIVGPNKNFFDGSYGLSAVVLPLLASLGVLIAGAARYRIPFIMLPIGIVFTIMVTFAADHSASDTPYKLLLGACGLSILAVAVYFDLKDPQRVLRHSDFAFWSYMIGSPLFVHSLFLSVLIDGDAIIGAGTWLLIAVMIVLVSSVAVILNRRALILSTMLYVGYVLFMMLKGTPMGAATIVFVVGMLIGTYVIALGSHWVKIRSALMQRLPDWQWLKRVPPYAS